METSKFSNPLFTLTVGEFVELNKNINRELYNELFYENKVPIKEEKEILTIAEAADFLKLSKSTIYQMNIQRKIPHLKRGKRVYYKRSELLEWLDEGRVKTQKDIEEESISYLMKATRKRYK